MADAAIQTLARQMELLFQQVAALSSHLIAADAVDGLMHDPRLPDHLRHVADLLRVEFPRYCATRVHRLDHCGAVAQYRRAVASHRARPDAFQ